MNKIIISVLIVISLIISGCSNTEPSIDIKKIIEEDSQVQDFMNQNPNSNLKIIHYSINESSQLKEEFENLCEKKFSQKELTKFSLQSIEKNLELVGFFDKKNQIIGCISENSLNKEETQRDFLMKNIITKNISIDERPTLGDENAPIKIIVHKFFIDSYAKRVFDQYFTDINSLFIETGKASVSFSNFKVDGYNNLPSIIGECVYRELGEEKFFEFYFKNIEKSQTQFNELNMKEWTYNLGLSEKEFENCVE